MKISNSTIPMILAALAACNPPVVVPEGVTKKADLFDLLPDDMREDENEVKGTPPPVVENDFAAPDQVPLEVCNLVSQGKTLSEAWEIHLAGDGKEGEKLVATKKLNLIGLPTSHPDSRQGIFDRLSAEGKPQHPNMSTEKLVSVYRKEILGETDEA